MDENESGHFQNNRIVDRCIAHIWAMLQKYNRMCLHSAHILHVGKMHSHTDADANNP